MIELQVSFKYDPGIRKWAIPDEHDVVQADNGFVVSWRAENGYEILNIPNDAINFAQWSNVPASVYMSTQKAEEEG